MSTKSYAIAVALMAFGAVGVAHAGSADRSGAKPQLCTNDKAKADDKHMYSAECPSVSGMKQPDGTWVPANDGPGKSPAPDGTSTKSDDMGAPSGDMAK